MHIFSFAESLILLTDGVRLSVFISPSSYFPMQSTQFLRQDYAAYTAEDAQVWKILFERQIQNMPGRAATAFLDGLARIDFRADEIPNFERTNDHLRRLTGWEVVAVPGLIADDLFFQMLADRQFPAATWLRKMSQLDYLEEPDMFHDVFAHVPLLTNQAFVDFLQDLSRLALAHIRDPWAIELLSRIYWFTVEFGLIHEPAGLRIYGAGILSSAGETKFSLSEAPAHLDYDVSRIMQTAYWKDKFQDKYFIISSYEQLYGSIPEIQSVLATMLREVPA